MPASPVSMKINFSKSQYNWAYKIKGSNARSYFFLKNILFTILKTR
jgi:hypothetical protein